MRSIENGNGAGRINGMSGEPDSGLSGLRRSDVAVLSPQEKLQIALSVQSNAPEYHKLLEKLHFPGKVWFVSNRLPGSYGGLVTAVGAIVNALGEGKVGWLGWSGKTAPREREAWDEIPRSDISSAVPAELDRVRKHSNRVERTVERNGAEKIGLTLTDEQHDKYYSIFSNEVLWYLLHGGSTMRFLYDTMNGHKEGAMERVNGELVSTDVFKGGYTRAKEAEAFKTYQEVNKLFADTILDEDLEGNPYASKDDFIWFQDYHLMLAGKYVRESRPDQKTGFFLHTPFCSPEEFETLYQEMGEDVGNAILTGMLYYDLVGFSTPANRDSYIKTLKHFMKHDKYGASLRKAVGDIQIIENGEEVNIKIKNGNVERTVSLNAYAVGIDAHAFTNAANDPEVITKAQDLSKVLPSEDDDPEYIFGHVNPNPEAVFITYVGRAELTKGLYELIQMYTDLVDENPHLREYLQLLIISPLNREDLFPYKNKNRKMFRAIKSLIARGRRALHLDRKSGKIGYGLHHDLVYMNMRGLSGKALSALNARSNLALGTSNADGTLLTTKEAASVGTIGLNGENIGATWSMPSTPTVNPKDRRAYREAVEHELSLDMKQLKARIKAAAEEAYKHSSFKFAGDFLGGAQAKLYPKAA